ncbi:MAG: sugar ABC transporter ATP-binding protein [Eubacteriales bacterium]|nr:sugar ABC transporter ATP-binding protein [Eubacteriales bacterium]
MKDISKSFSDNKVLDRVRLSVEAGEVHALLGENGAGKSTLMKILGGIYSRDEGEILINGERADIHDVVSARDHGISIIHQELMMAQHLTIAENVFMGREIMKNGMVDLAEQERRTQEFLDKYGMGLGAGTQLRRLTIAKQQMVEIIKAVSFGAKIIVMDEPTSSLSETEVEILYDMIRTLKKEQVAIIYISHRLNELYEITDRTTIMRDGEYIGTVVTKETDRDQLIAMMVGRDLSSYYTKNDHVQDEIVLEVRDLSDGDRVKKADFDLRKGEILGVAGLVGAGRSETMECLFGITRRKGGKVIYKGREVSFKNPVEAMEAGFGLVPEDRKKEGLFLQSGVRFNTTINVIPQFMKRLVWNRSREDEIVEEKIRDMHIKVTGPEQTVGKLSGGNQQKVLIGRWLCSTRSVLILDEPTRGVDVKTKAEIYALIDKLAEQGLSIIMVSSELPELINMSDRVMVMSGGMTTGVLGREELSQERIMQLATMEVTA